MTITGIIGYPLTVTYSPRMHKAAFEALNIKGVYLELPVEPKRLEEVLNALRVIGCRGINVTVPHKQSIMPFLSEISKEAEAVGAVNTIVFKPDGLVGYNTDVHGFEVLLRNLEFELNYKTFVLLGAGGVARAAAYVLRKHNPHNFYINDIIVSRAQDLAQKYNAIPLKTEERRSLIQQADLVINATPVDLQNEVVNNLPEGAAYLDLNYKFRLKPRAGIKLANGLEMLLHQGAKAFEIWTDVRAPIEIMRKALGSAND
jgi:shikimate dehydrogenase